MSATNDPGPVIREIVFDTQADDTDRISDILMALGALSVVVEDGQTDPAFESPLVGEPGSPMDVRSWPHSRVVVLLDVETDPAGFWQAFCEEDPRFEATPTDIRDIKDRDWVSETQRQFAPFNITHRLWVGPQWLTPPDHAGSIVLRIDPGMAFGTGSHATTQLCLEALLDVHDQRQHAAAGGLGDVLDIGCGSGVLAIAAAKLGARHVHAVDIDPQAVDIARRNAGANDVQIDVRDAAGPSMQADVVMANILAQPLRLLAPMLARATRPGGSLILSGILARQSDELLAIYGPLTLHLGPLAVLRERDGWVCLGTLGAPGATSGARGQGSAHS